LIWKAKPRCPNCGSSLLRHGKGYSCPNPECDVFKVFFDRDLKVRRVTYKGFAFVKMFGRDLK
jgi:tRNA(Ile2) C34 agmatinyltransferase TiaS